MENKNAYQAQLFSNRLAKNYRQLKKWARKNRISCWRLYDRDIPEVPLCLDLYTFLPDEIDSKIEAARYYQELNAAISENSPQAESMVREELERTFIHMYLYERPYDKPEEEEELWLGEMQKAAAEVLSVRPENIIVKRRRHQTENKTRSQYNRMESSRSVTGTVMEQGQLFSVNLTDYIDSGLFFDHRPLRSTVRSQCGAKRVLNLFCYTGAFSVYSAEGGASYVESVDMSNTYMDWARRNMELNGFCDRKKYAYTAGDAVKFLSEREKELKDRNEEKFDIIILDPPTFSNSKKTDTLLDINRDWPMLVKKCTALLSDRGILYFSTNSRKLVFDDKKLPENYAAKEITAQTIPEDYRNAKIHRAWAITKKV